MKTENRKISQVLFDLTWNSVAGSFVFWSCLLLITRVLGKDLSQEFPPDVYIVLVMVCGIGWTIQYIAEKMIRIFAPDDSTMKYHKFLAIVSVTVSILIWSSFCLILSVRPIGIVSFTLILIATAAVYMFLILTKNLFQDKETFIEMVKYYLGFDDDDDDDNYYY